MSQSVYPPYFRDVIFPGLPKIIYSVKPRQFKDKNNPFPPQQKHLMQKLIGLMDREQTGFISVAYTHLKAFWQLCVAAENLVYVFVIGVDPSVQKEMIVLKASHSYLSF